MPKKPTPTFEQYDLRAQEGLGKHAQRLGVDPLIRGREFTSTRYSKTPRGWKVMGLHLRIRKLPIVAHDENRQVRSFTLGDLEGPK